MSKRKLPSLSLSGSTYPGVFCWSFAQGLNRIAQPLDFFFLPAHYCGWLLLPVTASAGSGRQGGGLPSLAAIPAAALTADIWRHQVGHRRHQPEVAHLSGAACRKQGSYFSHCRSVNFGQYLVTVTQFLWSCGAPLTDNCCHQKPRAAAGGNGDVWQSWQCSCGHGNAPGDSWGCLLSTAYSSHHWNLLSFPTQSPKTAAMCLPLSTHQPWVPPRQGCGGCLTGPHLKFNSRDDQTVALCWVY